MQSPLNVVSALPSSATGFSVNPLHQQQTGKDTIAIRPWKYSDLEAVFDMHNELIQPSSGILSFPKSHFQSHFHSPQGRVLLAFSASSTPSSNTPIAFLTYSLLIASAPNILSSRPTSSACTPPLLVLETVGVAPQFQRNGIARALIEKAVEEAKTLAGRREGEGGQRRVRVRVWMREGGEEERVLEGLIGKEEGGVGGMGGKVKKEGKNGWWSGVI